MRHYMSIIPKKGKYRLPDMDKKQFDVAHASLHEYNPKERKIRKVGI